MTRYIAVEPNCKQISQQAVHGLTVEKGDFIGEPLHVVFPSESRPTPSNQAKPAA